MVSGKAKQQHSKIVLAGSDDCYLAFCRDCQVVELNLGAMTLRLKPEALRNLNLVFQQATLRLEHLQAMKIHDQSLQTVMNDLLH